MINFSFSGTFRWFGEQFQRYVERNVESKMDEAGKKAVTMARHLVPILTGQTRDSINYTYNKSKHELSLHADTFWSVFVERGTSKMAARPFLAPSLQAVSDVWDGPPLHFRSVFANAPGKYQKGYQKRAHAYMRGRAHFSTQVGRGRFN